MIVTMATITAKEGKRDELSILAIRLVSETRKEQGCISYDYYLSSEDDYTAIFVEKWSGSDALKEHLKTVHFKKFFADSKDLLDEPGAISTYEANEIEL